MLVYAIGVLALLGAVAVVLSRAHQTIHTPAVGLDLHPVYYAGKAVIERRSVYLDQEFVYPPPAALLWAPIAQLVSYHQATVATAYLQAGLIAITILGVSYLAVGSPWWLAVGGAGTILVLKGDFAIDSLWLENSSLFLVPIAGLIVLCTVRRSWWWLAGLVAASILIKPILVPFLAILLVARRWRELAMAIGLPVLLSLLALPIVSNFRSFVTVVHRVAGGTDLVGLAPVYNLSLEGLGHYHHLSPAAIGLFRLVVAAVVIAMVFKAWRVRAEDPVELVAVGTAAYVGLLLAGSLAEVHYEFAAVPGLIFVGFRSRSLVAKAALGLAGLMLAFSSYYLDAGGSIGDAQLRAILFELLLLTGCVAAVPVWARRREIEPEIHRAPRLNFSPVGREEMTDLRRGASVQTDRGARGQDAR